MSGSSDDSIVTVCAFTIPIAAAADIRGEGPKYRIDPSFESIVDCVRVTGPAILPPPLLPSHIVPYARSTLAVTTPLEHRIDPEEAHVYFVLPRVRFRVRFRFMRTAMFA
jgi:hypothetical protein